jgi:hypothetical protein
MLLELSFTIENDNRVNKGTSLTLELRIQSLDLSTSTGEGTRKISALVSIQRVHKVSALFEVVWRISTLVWQGRTAVTGSAKAW